MLCNVLQPLRLSSLVFVQWNHVLVKMAKQDPSQPDSANVMVLLNDLVANGTKVEPSAFCASFLDRALATLKPGERLHTAITHRIHIVTSKILKTSRLFLSC